MAGQAALRLQGVTKSFGGHAVLRGLELEVRPGQCVALLGPNGAGKSTLLRIAATLARPREGQVHVAGIDARREPESARAQLSILTQEAPVYPELTPHGHVRWWARVQRLPAPDADARLQEAGLAHAAHQPARNLSRGMRQRLALTLALLPDRPLLLLDEPFAALDEAGRAWLSSNLTARRGRTAVVMALHDAAQAQALANSVLRLNAGRLEAA